MAKLSGKVVTGLPDHNTLYSFFLPLLPIYNLHPWPTIHLQYADDSQSALFLFEQAILK